MKKPIFSPLLAAVIVYFICLLFPVSYLKGIISDTDLTKVSTANDVSRFKNVFLQQQELENQKYVTMVGSSTIGIFSRYHPSNYFPTDMIIPYLEGQPGATGLLHVLDFAALAGSLHSKKLVYILDPADFMKPNGIPSEGFTKYYSSYQGYSFLFNSEITNESKRKVAPRLLHYSIIKKDPLLSSELEGYVYHDFWHQTKSLALKPAAWLRLKLLEKQDFLTSFHEISQPNHFKQQSVPRNISWDKLSDDAEKEAAKQAGNNPFGLLNSDYTAQKQKYLKSKNTWKPNHFLDSVEYDDLQMILDILHSEHAQPLFVLLPRKGVYSDYLGFTQPYRKQLYSKIRNEVEAEGFQVLDYSNKEYDKYFMRDPNHLGWKGWVQVDKDISLYENLN